MSKEDFKNQEGDIKKTLAENQSLKNKLLELNTKADDQNSNFM